MRALGRLADLPVPEHDPAQAREVADEVLSSSAYQWDEPSRTRSSRWPGGSPTASTTSCPRDLPAGGGTLPTWVGCAVLGIIVAGVLLVVWRRGPGSAATPGSTRRPT